MYTPTHEEFIELGFGYANGQYWISDKYFKLLRFNNGKFSFFICDKFQYGLWFRDKKNLENFINKM